jgi:hypothetical protein
MDEEDEIAILELRVQSAIFLLDHENLEFDRRSRLIEFLERVATGEEFILMETENKSENYDERDFRKKDTKRD